MHPRLFTSFAMLLLAACGTAHQSAPLPDRRPSTELVTAIVYRADGALVAVIDGPRGCSVRVTASTSATTDETVPPQINCSSARLFAAGDGVVLSDDSTSIWLNADAKTGPSVLALAASDNRIEKSGGVARWIVGEKSVTLPASLLRPQPLSDGSAVIATQRTGEGERVVRLGNNGEVSALTEPFAAIDSLALDPKSKEVAFSAKRDSYDVGLVSTSGSKVSWVGPDSSDEVSVTWAPRGNKITYVAKQFGGTTFRSVHIPTGYQVAADFPDMYARSVAWHPQAERFAAIVSSPLASDHVQSIRYGGEERRTEIAPSMARDGVIEPLVMDGVSAVLVNPPSVRYGQRYPLVVVKSASTLSWSPITTLHSEGAGILLVPEEKTMTADFWSEVKRLVWVDETRSVVVFPGVRDVVPPSMKRVAPERRSGDRGSDTFAADAARSAIKPKQQE